MKNRDKESISVSVIMPVLNGRCYIGEAIQSVLDQSLTNIELIIVDAGSADGTIDIIEEYRIKDDRVKLLSSPRKSMGFQYNLGISRARGVYVGFVESDDCIDPMIYERLLFEAEENELDFVKSDFDLFVDLEDGNRYKLHYPILETINDELYGKVLRPENYPALISRDVAMWNGIYRRDFINENNIKLNETPGAAFQDTGYVAQTLMKANRVKYIDALGYQYRQDNAGASFYDSRRLAYINNEIEFVMQCIGEGIDSWINAEICKRMIRLFCNFYRRSLANDDSSSGYTEEIKRFRMNVLSWVSGIPQYKTDYLKIKQDMEIYSLFFDESFFDLYERKKQKQDSKRQEIFFDKVRRYEEYVIVGTGKTARCCYAKLIRRGMTNISCFCLITPNRIPCSSVMGIDVRRLKDVVKEHPEALYIISYDRQDYRDACDALSKINQENICQAYENGYFMAFRQGV